MDPRYLRPSARERHPGLDHWLRQQGLDKKVQEQYRRKRKPDRKDVGRLLGRLVSEISWLDTGSAIEAWTPGKEVAVPDELNEPMEAVLKAVEGQPTPG